MGRQVVPLLGGELEARRGGHFSFWGEAAGVEPSRRQGNQRRKRSLDHLRLREKRDLRIAFIRAGDLHHAGRRQFVTTKAAPRGHQPQRDRLDQFRRRCATPGTLATA